MKRFAIKLSTLSFICLLSLLAAQTSSGDTFVIKAGAQHEVLGTNSIGEPCRTSIAIADGKLFIREEKHLFCIGNKG